MADYDRFNEVAQEEQKWWQKTWFIVLMIFLFFPVGLFLMYRYTKYKTAAIVLAVCIVSYSTYAHFTRPAPNPASVAPASSMPASTTSAQTSATPVKQKEVAEQEKIEAKKQEEQKKAAEYKAEQDRILMERKPVATSIKNNIASAIGNAENLSVTVYDEKSFDVSFDMDIPNQSEDAAKAVGADAIQTVQEICSDHELSLISVVVTCKRAPIGFVSYSPADDKYTFVANGKRSEFTP